MSLRMAVNLNAVLHGRLALAPAAAGVQGTDVAHHVLDPDQVLGLDPTDRSDLAAVLGRVAASEPEAWVLALPEPGSLGSLRGPKEFNQAALAVGEAVVAIGGGLGLVPFRVGQAVQWRVFPAERPFAPPTPYEAERQLSEAVLTAATTLARLEVAGGVRQQDMAPMRLAPGYHPRQIATADRASRLLGACDLALLSDGAAISAFEVDARFRELRSVRLAAARALCAAATWIER